MSRSTPNRGREPLPDHRVLSVCHYDSPCGVRDSCDTRNVRPHQRLSWSTSRLTSCLAERRCSGTGYNTVCVSPDTQLAEFLFLFWRILRVLLVWNAGRTVSFRPNKNGSTLVPATCLVCVWVILPSLSLFGHSLGVSLGSTLQFLQACP